MDPTQSECPSNTGGDQQAKDNKYKRKGQIEFRMPNFKEFSKGRGPKEVFSDTVEFINGLLWQMRIKHHDSHVGIYLNCCADETDAAWTSRAAFQFSVVSCKRSAECFMMIGNLNSFEIYYANSESRGYEQFASIKELMDPKNGFYDEKADAVTFKAEVVAEEPNGMA
uniref:MATH domain-containing protein n=1 Tax=Globodera pallida TaxID=36090 RepID=A0A183C568_GLOPA